MRYLSVEFESYCCYLPAKRILIRSNGCNIIVDATPPDTPATRCSYFTCEKRLNLILVGLVGAVLGFILILFYVWLGICYIFLIIWMQRNHFQFLSLIFVQLTNCTMYKYIVLFTIFGLELLLWVGFRIKVTETRCTWPQFELLTNLSCCYAPIFVCCSCCRCSSCCCCYCCCCYYVYLYISAFALLPSTYFLFGNLTQFSFQVVFLLLLCS